MTQLKRSSQKLLSENSMRFEVLINKESIFNVKKDSRSRLFEDSEEFDVLLDKQSIHNLGNESIYDLEKIPGVLTPTPTSNSKQLPPHLNDGLKKLLSPPSNTDYDTEPSSQRSEDDYLPSTLRAAISITNDTEMITRKHKDDNINPTGSPPSASNRKSRNFQEKSRTRTLRRTKSEKNKNPRVSKTPDENLTQSLHARVLDTSTHAEKPSSAISLERMCRSEELAKPEKRDSGKDRRRSENLHQRPSSFRREKGRSRKGSSNRNFAVSKPVSDKKSKINRKVLGIAEDDKLHVDWNRLPSMSEKQKERSQEKLKKSSSDGSNAKRTRRPSKSRRNLLQAPVVTESDKKNSGWKRRSPHQENRKKPPKQKHGSKKLDPEKPSESSAIRSKKPKSRRAMLMSSKATTESCRDLLRKIHSINNDRLSSEKRSVSTIKEESQNSSAELPPRSARSLRKDRVDKEIKESNEKSLPVSDRNNNSSKSRRKLHDDDRPHKPPRTKSAPLTLKGKSSTKKMLRSKSGNVLLKTDLEDVQTKPKKKTFSSRLLEMLSEGKGAGEIKEAEDVTVLTGNRNKDKKERKRFLRRSKSESSLRENAQKMKSSNYDLMISMHSTATDEKMEKKNYNVKDSGRASDPEQLQMLSLVTSEDTNEGSSEMISIANSPKEETRKVGSKNQGEHMNEHYDNTFEISEHCDDIISIAEFSPQKAVKIKEAQISKPKQPSCLQIDFSQLSEHGTSGNIFVRSKKLERRVNAKNGKPKSNRQVRA